MGRPKGSLNKNQEPQVRLVRGVNLGELSLMAQRLELLLNHELILDPFSFFTDDKGRHFMVRPFPEVEHATIEAIKHDLWQLIELFKQALVKGGVIERQPRPVRVPGLSRVRG